MSDNWKQHFVWDCDVTHCDASVLLDNLLSLHLFQSATKADAESARRNEDGAERPGETGDDMRPAICNTK